MKLQDLKGKKVYLLGYGIEGKATEAFLKTVLQDIEIGIGDLSMNESYLEEQSKYDIAIRSPGIPKKLVTIPYTTATNLFFSEVKGKTIGITGTKGKSTTASLIYEILKEAGEKVRLAGNIGTPMLEQLLENNEEDTTWVLELSSYMLDDIEYSPDISVVVSLYGDHQDYHNGLENYHNAKRNIIKYADSDDIFIYNPKFTALEEWARNAICKSTPYMAFEINDGQSLLQGEHNKQNIQAAVTVAKQFNIDDDVIYHALKTFKPLRHRLENVGIYKGIIFYDDAISTTPESTIQAINAIPDVATVFLGGLDRGYDFTPLINTLIEKQIQNFVFFPDSGKTMKQMLEAKNHQFQSIETSSMADAVQFAYAHTPENMVCLLSTASPSYSVWKNFEEKGDQFQQYVKEYGEKDSTEKNTDISQTG